MEPKPQSVDVSKEHEKCIADIVVHNGPQTKNVWESLRYSGIKHGWGCCEECWSTICLSSSVTGLRSPWAEHGSCGSAPVHLEWAGPEAQAGRRDGELDPTRPQWLPSDQCVWRPGCHSGDRCVQTGELHWMHRYRSLFVLLFIFVHRFESV